MNPDPFRRLDPIDPPDRWDDIVARTELDASAHAEIGALDRAPRRRTPTLVAAAAAVALIGGAGLALARNGGDTPQELATSSPDTSATTTASTAAPSSTPAGLEGVCPFALDGIPLAAGAIMHLSVSYSASTATQGHGEIDGTAFDVAVGSFDSSDSMPLRPAGDPGIGVSYGWTSDLSDLPPEGHASVHAGVDGGPGPCDDVVVSVHVPLPFEHATFLREHPPHELMDFVDDDSDVSQGYIAQARPLLDQLLAAVIRTG